MSMENYAIIETDNLGSDYPNESFVIRGIRNKQDAQTIADLINKHKCVGPTGGNRFWKVEEDKPSQPYKLQPSFYEAEMDEDTKGMTFI